jgi:hypothetical protein
MTTPASYTRVGVVTEVRRLDRRHHTVVVCDKNNENHSHHVPNWLLAAEYRNDPAGLVGRIVIITEDRPLQRRTGRAVLVQVVERAASLPDPESQVKPAAGVQIVERAGLSPPDPREVSDVCARRLGTLRDAAYLGGYVPVTTIFTGQRYDLLFFEDRLLIVPCRRTEVLAVLPYGAVEDVEIGGPGLVRTGGGFVGGGFGAAGAIEGMAIASVLNGLTSRTSVKTIVRIQAANCELFLLHTRMPPDQLRIELAHPLGVIRAARAASARAIQHESSLRSASPVDELAKLADMLEKGLLTREEFDLIKAKFLAS